MKPKLSTSTDPRGENLHPGELAARIAAREAWIGVVGLGSVGLPLSRALLDAGHRVVGIDTDPERNRSLLAGITPVAHLGPRFARELIEHERFELCETRLLDVALIAVPTPLDARGQPDLGCVRAAARAMARRVRPGGLIVLESTSHPGTTRQIVGEELRCVAGGIARARGSRPAERAHGYDPQARRRHLREQRPAGGGAVHKLRGDRASGREHRGRRGRQAVRECVSRGQHRTGE
jgi:hypothetical protein